MSKKKYRKVYDGKKLTIFEKASSLPPLFDPKQPDDVTELCQLTQLKEFIQETNKSYPRLMLFKSDDYNIGVITMTPIKKNRIISEYRGEVGSLDNVTKRSNIKKLLLKNKQIKATSSNATINKKMDQMINRISHYAFEIKRNLDVMAHDKRSIAGFINHNSTDANVKSDIVKGVIYYKAARDISPFEQLLVDYGPDYDYQDGLRYIPCMENHQSTGLFLASHLRDYSTTPLKITAQQKRLLQCKQNLLLLPHYLQDMLNSHQIKKATVDQSVRRYPLIALSSYQTETAKKQLYLADKQQNITALILACALRNPALINLLINHHKIDIFAKTTDDLDALIVAIKSSPDESAFLHLAKSLLMKITAKCSRTDTIGCDQDGKTALHLLVARQWCKAIHLCDNAIFFDIVDSDGYDPLLFAIAHGKTAALKALLALRCVKKKLDELLLAEDETREDDILTRAVKHIPHAAYQEVRQLLETASKRKPAVKKQVKRCFAMFSRAQTTT